MSPVGGNDAGWSGRGEGSRRGGWGSGVGRPVLLELHSQVTRHCHFSEVFLAEWPIVLRDDETIKAGTINTMVAFEWR